MQPHTWLQRLYEGRVQIIISQSSSLQGSMMPLGCFKDWQGHSLRKCSLNDIKQHALKHVPSTTGEWLGQCLRLASLDEALLPGRAECRHSSAVAPISELLRPGCIRRQSPAKA